MFIKSPYFEIIQVADDYMAVPIGDETETLKGVVALSEPTFFMINLLSTPKSREELISALISEYDVCLDVLNKDLDDALNSLVQIGVIKEYS